MEQFLNGLYFGCGIVVSLIGMTIIGIILMGIITIVWNIVEKIKGVDKDE